VGDQFRRRLANTRDQDATRLYPGFVRSVLRLDPLPEIVLVASMSCGGAAESHRRFEQHRKRQLEVTANPHNEEIPPGVPEPPYCEKDPWVLPEDRVQYVRVSDPDLGWGLVGMVANHSLGDLPPAIDAVDIVAHGCLANADQYCDEYVQSLPNYDRTKTLVIAPQFSRPQDLSALLGALADGRLLRWGTHDYRHDSPAQLPPKWAEQIRKFLNSKGAQLVSELSESQYQRLIDYLGMEFPGKEWPTAPLSSFHVLIQLAYHFCNRDRLSNVMRLRIVGNSEGGQTVSRLSFIGSVFEPLEAAKIAVELVPSNQGAVMLPLAEMPDESASPSYSTTDGRGMQGCRPVVEGPQENLAAVRAHPAARCPFGMGNLTPHMVEGMRKAASIPMPPDWVQRVTANPFLLDMLWASAPDDIFHENVSVEVKLEWAWPLCLAIYWSIRLTTFVIGAEEMLGKDATDEQRLKAENAFLPWEDGAWQQGDDRFQRLRALLDQYEWLIGAGALPYPATLKFAATPTAHRAADVWAWLLVRLEILHAVAKAGLVHSPVPLRVSLLPHDDSRYPRHSIIQVHPRGTSRLCD
jgi:hypothetical protein